MASTNNNNINNYNNNNMTSTEMTSTANRHPDLDPCVVTFICEMKRKETHFRNICRQLVLMNNQIRCVRTRYQRAVSESRRSFRYQHRLHLMTLEGVRNKFTEYATQQADELDAMEEDLQEEYGLTWDDAADIADGGATVGI